MELHVYSYVLEIPNNGYTTLKSYWLSNTQSRVLQADWLVLENNEKANFNISMRPITEATEGRDHR